jgi:Leucine-rich repeat (LRR) protein
MKIPRRYSLNRILWLAAIAEIVALLRKIPRRFSLKSLLLFTTLVALLVGLHCLPDPELRERVRLHELGVTWYRGYDPVRFTFLPWRTYDPVVVVEVEDQDITDAKLTVLASLSSLRELRLFNCPRVTKKVVEQFEELPNLEKITLSGPQITDEWIDALCRLDNVRKLALPNTQITDAGVERLQSMSNLRTLNLHGTPITDEALRFVKNIPLLQLDVSDTAVTDQGLKHLGENVTLRSITVAGTEVTGKGINAYLTSLPETSVTFPEVRVLADRTQLQTVEPGLQFNGGKRRGW